MADRLAAVRRETTPAGSPSPGGLGVSSPLGPLPEAGITARPIPIPTMSPAMSFGPESKSTPVPKETLTHLDIMPKLLHSEHSVVKTRSGAVLSRGFIMKTDHYPSGRALDLDINLHGAPNFRTPRKGPGLNIFGVAQPRTQGLRAILSVLRASPGTADPTKVIWFSTREEPIVYISGRPFVLRDASAPRITLRLSDRAENLEAIEQRLKLDILAETAKYGGLLLTHNEAAVSDVADGQAAILPTWTAVDSANVRTSRELWEGMKEKGWNVDYYRIPIFLDRGVEDSYLDPYLRILRSTSPLESAVVFSCGTGAVRTTFSMVAASLIRRKQLLNMGLPDPYAAPIGLGGGSRIGTPIVGIGSPGVSTPSGVGLGLGSDRLPTTPPTVMNESRIVQSLEQAAAQTDMQRSLLRLTSVLQQKLPYQSAIELLLTQPTLLDDLRRAHSGNYSAILSLLGVLDNGLAAKKLVDAIIDACDHVTNLRETILSSRIDYSLSTSLSGEDDAKREAVLDRAVRSLEKYFYMITFASYVDEQPVDGFDTSFSDWLKARTEIANQVTFLRKSYGSRLNVFAPVSDLSALSRATGATLVQQNDVEISGGQILGDEYTEHVIRNRSGIILREGTLLKSDQWLKESQHVENALRGAINFRTVPGTPIYALGQPTTDAVDEVVRRVRQDHPNANKILWITLREEPIVYVNGAPYCLRRERFTLRNMKDYGGISASRLETLEDRLRQDVAAELQSFGGRLLLHTETSSGAVIPVWENASPDSVETIKDIMEARRSIAPGVELVHARIPLTAERPPDFSDIAELMEVVMRSDSVNTPIVVNCQLGRGRSTLTSIILLLIMEWLHKPRLSMSASQSLERRPRANRAMSTFEYEGLKDSSPVIRNSYQIINNLLRVVRKGRSVKDTVDIAIDRSGEVENLRDAIEQSRLRAEEAPNDLQKKDFVNTGLQNLRRYFQLILFQSYLQNVEPDTAQNLLSFESFVQNTPVIKTFEKELLTDSSDALKPLERINANAEAAPDEVTQIVANRSGIILSASTILKSDFFSNLQKMSLPERIDGSPNFRRVPLTFSLSQDGRSEPDFQGKMAVGSGMPTIDGLRNALQRVEAGPGGANFAFWTSLREEPVIYVAGRPHVLRLVDRPLENVEATGVDTQVVERMEESLKKDILREIVAGNGRILLHDEVEDRPGSFSIVPIWETITKDDILTPRDVFTRIISEGYQVDYGRVAITDEQAPLPEALAHLVDRVEAGLPTATDFIFNCQMGRGRTTSGQVAASLIATTNKPDWNHLTASSPEPFSASVTTDSFSEEEAYMEGEYKIILQLVGVLSHGKVAKRLADRAIDLMQDVQNLRKAIYPYKLKLDTLPKGSPQHRRLQTTAVNYLYRYGTLITFANYLIERREGNVTSRFPDWLKEHREISSLLSRTSLD